MPAIAISNNDIALIAWKLDKKVPGCLGFAIYRKDSSGRETPLPAWVGFEDQTNPGWKARTTVEWPVQKFTWRDLEAKRGETYTYRITPMVGTPAALTPDSPLSQVTNPVTITEKRGSFSAFFNRGILSTQSLSHRMAGAGGSPGFGSLMGKINKPGDPLRDQLSGQLREAMLGLFSRAKSRDLEMYCALYELTDPELIQQLLDAKGFVHVILSNAGKDDDENAPARKALHDAGIDVTDRMVAEGHIGHNKFAVLTARGGKPAAAVWTGSTNWTDTGLCAQCNNGLLVESPELASAYKDYWDRLWADGSAQGQTLRMANQRPRTATIPGTTEADVWYSPNTKQTSKPSNAATPLDMAEVFSAMDDAKDALLVRGAVTDPRAVDDFETHLYHRSAAPGSAEVVAAAAINDQFGYWEKELLKAPGAHAIIHDKIVVVDPLSPACVVITGSHNLGFRASYNNDENLLIIRGNQDLARAYAAHVMDVYDHYRWRFTLGKNGDRAWTGLARDDGWQDKYFSTPSAAAQEIDFWTKGAEQARPRTGD
jgi:phosphatidylserine/phosphatidylglycerophosphate/cardiolipin synthase-like enzyme